MNIGNANDAPGSGPSILYQRSRGTTTTPSLVSNGDNIGNVVFSGYDGDTFKSAVAIRGQIDGAPGLNDMPGVITFETTADGASSTTERMRIDSSGNIGIGETPSTHMFQIRDKSQTGDVFQIRAGTDAGVLDTDATLARIWANDQNWRGVLLALGKDNGDDNFDAAFEFKTTACCQTNWLSPELFMRANGSTTGGTIVSQLSGSQDSSGSIGIVIKAQESDGTNLDVADLMEIRNGSQVWMKTFGGGINGGFTGMTIGNVASAGNQGTLTLDDPQTGNTSLIIKSSNATGHIIFKDQGTAQDNLVFRYQASTKPGVLRVTSTGGADPWGAAGLELSKHGWLGFQDGITPPATDANNMGLIYIDSADGDLKIKFSDGVVRTIVTD